jgi:hypothetical protein
MLVLWGNNICGLHFKELNEMYYNFIQSSKVAAKVGAHRASYFGGRLSVCCTAPPAFNLPVGRTVAAGG